MLINHYERGGTMGWHHDGDESKETIRKGKPVISISLGDDTFFQFAAEANSRRFDFRLKSGDAFVFGKQSRLGWHGVGPTYNDSGPTKQLPGGAVVPVFGFPGRINLTFKQY